MASVDLSCDYLGRFPRAAMKRRLLDGLALRALMKATHLLDLALPERLRQHRCPETMRDSASRLVKPSPQVPLRRCTSAYLPAESAISRK